MNDIPREIFCDDGKEVADEQYHAQQSQPSSATSSYRSLKQAYEDDFSPLPWRGWPDAASPELLPQERNLKEDGHIRVKPSLLLRSMSQKLFPRRNDKQPMQGASTCTTNVDKITTSNMLQDTKRTLENRKTVDDAVAKINERLDALDLLLQNYLDEIDQDDADEEEKKQIRVRYAKRILG